MKKIDEYTEKEWLLMTDEEATKLVKFTAINEGIPLVDKPVIFEKEEKTLKFESYFYNPLFPNMFFVDLGFLNELIEIVTNSNHVRFGENYKYIYIDNIQVNKLVKSLKIDETQIKKCAEEKEFNELQLSLKETEQQRKDFKNELELYNNSIKDLQEIENQIRLFRMDAHSREYLRINLLAKFETNYLPLIEDKQTALNLFNKAFNLPDFVFDYISEKHTIEKKC